MRLTTKTRHAVACLADLVGANEPVSLDDLAARHCLSKSTLEQMFALLVAAGYAIGQKGPRGGYRLARHASDITVAGIRAVVEIERLERGTSTPWLRASNAIHRLLEVMTLADLAGRPELIEKEPWTIYTRAVRIGLGDFRRRAKVRSASSSWSSGTNWTDPLQIAGISFPSAQSIEPTHSQEPDMPENTAPGQAGLRSAARLEVVERLRRLQIGQRQRCAFCGVEYELTPGEAYRPGDVCAACWPSVSEIERRHARDRAQRTPKPSTVKAHLRPAADCDTAIWPLCFTLNQLSDRLLEKNARLMTWLSIQADRTALLLCKLQAFLFRARNR